MTAATKPYDPGNVIDFLLALRRMAERLEREQERVQHQRSLQVHMQVEHDMRMDAARRRRRRPSQSGWFLKVER